MKLTLAELAKILDGKVVGNDTVIVNGLAKIENAKNGDIAFLSNPKYSPWLYKTNASVVIINNDLKYENKNIPNLISVDNSYLSFNLLLNKYGQKKIQFFGLSKLSSVSKSSVLGSNVSVGKYSIIESKTTIGNESIIMDNVSIQKNVKIGNNCTIYSGVRIYEDCQIGDNCIIHSNCVIGSDGFGYAPNQDGEYIKTPQLGNVSIGNNVEIGSNSSVDRATLGSTIISDGVKIDNLVQIAHNVKIGKNTVIAGQCGVAGSTTIGENCQIGGQVGIIGHLTIGNNVRINGKTGVFSNIKDDTVLRGNPAIEEKIFNRSYVYFRNFEKIAADVNALKKLHDNNN